MHTDRLPRIAITVGDPSGIGPEIAVKSSLEPRVLEVAEIVIYGPSTDEALKAFKTGEVTAESGRVAYETILQAVEDVQAERLDALVTGPINKAAFAAAGLPWKGHTDLLAHLTNAPRVAMMFHSQSLRVVLATVHVPLAEVPQCLTADLLETTIRLAAAELPRFGFPSPRLALAGLNPHAGEGGLLGKEEVERFLPVVAACRSDNIDITGPLPADTVFVNAVRGQFDAVVACYHDQGLIPIKLNSFHQAVNLTLGLPFIRTSPDYGTAFDIAYTNSADIGSMKASLQLAIRLLSV